MKARLGGGGGLRQCRGLSKWNKVRGIINHTHEQEFRSALEFSEFRMVCGFFKLRPYSMQPCAFLMPPKP